MKVPLGTVKDKLLMSGEGVRGVGDELKLALRDPLW